MKVPQATVVHCRKDSFHVYIGRPSPWGNPFVIGKDGSREEVIEKYKVWLDSQPYLLSKIHELQGKVLGCHCAPRPCHGNWLAELANEESGSEIFEPYPPSMGHLHPSRAIPMFEKLIEGHEEDDDVPMSPEMAHLLADHAYKLA